MIIKKFKSAFKAFFKKHRIKTGIRSGKLAYTGPGIVQMDIMDACINKCITCWTHSPYLDKAYTSQFKHHMSFEDIQTWIKELKNTEVEEIHLAGAGEPLLHPKIKDILHFIKQQGLKIHLNTALYPLPENFAHFVVSQSIDKLTLSLWAGDAHTWQRTHPGVHPDHFGKIENFLTHVAKFKQEMNKNSPLVKHYHVISSENKMNLSHMLALAIKTHAEEIEFTVTDTAPGFTDRFALKPEDTPAIKAELLAFYDLNSYTEEFIGPGNKLDLQNVTLENEQKEFGRFYHSLPEGFSQNQKDIVCPSGQKYKQKSWIVNLPNPRFNFEYEHHVCHTCPHNPICYKTPESVPLQLGVTNLLGVGTFLRRIQASHTAQSGDPIVNTMPCTIGWQFSRILSNGQVVPCCKAAKHPLGNLHQASFKNIWNDSKYQVFRQNSLIHNKETPYFEKIKCSQGCDNLGMNLNAIHEKLVK